MEGKELMEAEFISKDIRAEAHRILELAFATDATSPICEKLELGYGEVNPLYVASDSDRLAMPISSLIYQGKQYFLGYLHE
jgi:hypothetical protein